MNTNKRIVNEFQKIKNLYEQGKTSFKIRNGTCGKTITREVTPDGEEKYTVELRKLGAEGREGLLTQTTFILSRKGEIQKLYFNFKTDVFGKKTVKMTQAKKPAAPAPVKTKEASPKVDLASGGISSGEKIVTAPADKPAKVKVDIDTEIERLEEKRKKMQEQGAYGKKVMAKGYDAAKAWTDEFNDLVDKISALEKQKRAGQLQVERTPIKEPPASAKKPSAPVTRSFAQTKKPVASSKEVTEKSTPRSFSAPARSEIPADEKPLEVPEGASFNPVSTYNPEIYSVYEVVKELKELIRKCPEGTIKQGELTISRHGNSYEIARTKNGEVTGYIAFDMYKEPDGEFTINRVERVIGDWTDIKGIGGIKDEVINSAYHPGESCSVEKGYTGQDPILRQLISPHKNELLRIDDEFNKLYELAADGARNKFVSGEEFGEKRVCKETNSTTLTLDSGATLEINLVGYYDLRFGDALKKIITVTKRDADYNLISDARYVFKLVDKATGEYKITKLYSGPEGERIITIGGNDEGVWEI